MSLFPMNRDKRSKQNYSSPRYLTGAATWAEEERAPVTLIDLCAPLHKMGLVIFSGDLVLAGQVSD